MVGSDSPVRSDPLGVAHAPPVADADGNDAPIGSPQAPYLLAVIGFGVPVVAYFAFIHHYGVNMIWLDQWYNVDLVGHPLTFSALWAQHGEHRMLFPNLIVVLLSDTTNLNIVFEEFLSAVVLCLSLGLFVLADKRSSPSTPWFYYCPLAFVILSFVQAQSTLFGFQLSWYLSILGLAVCLFLLDRENPTRGVLVGAIAAAVVGTFSAFEGLFIWPIGLMVLYRRRSSGTLLSVWTASALVTAGLFFYHYRILSHGYPMTHPLTTLTFFFLAVGDVVGARLGNPHYGNFAVLLLGIVIVAIACWVVVVYGLQRGRRPTSSIGVGLVSFGLLFAATFTIGRVSGGFRFAGQSQYTTFDLLILAGCYLALLHPPPPRTERARSDRTWPVLRTIVLGAVVLQVLFGTANGLTEAHDVYGAEIGLADIAANINRAPDSLVYLEVQQSPGWIRNEVRIAQAKHLSLFGTSAAASYRKEGLFPVFTEINTEVLLPADRAKLSGAVLLDAGVTSHDPISRVLFSLAAGSTSHVLGAGTPSRIGWIFRWRTTGVPNGTYELLATAYASDGGHSESPAIAVQVNNGPGAA